MTIERIIELLKIELECSQADCNRDCANCKLVQKSEDLKEMYENVISIMQRKLDVENRENDDEYLREPIGCFQN